MTSTNPSSPVNVSPSSAPVVAKSTFDVKAVAIEIARLLSDDKCSDITLLDVRGISNVQDFVVLASGTSDRQMRSAATDVKNLLPTLGSSVFRTSVDDQSTWIVVDCVDTVIHIFEPNTRAYYDLESMWGDAPKVEWLRAGQKPYSPDDQTNQLSESEEAAARDYRASSEPDADFEVTTGTAETFVEDVRSSVSKKTAAPAPKAKKAPAAKMKPAAKMLASPPPAPRAKLAKAAKKPAPVAAKAKAKPAAKPAKKAAAKKAAPAKKSPAKVAKKAPAKKAAKPVKKAAATKVVKKTAKKKGR